MANARTSARSLITVGLGGLVLLAAAALLAAGHADAKVGKHKPRVVKTVASANGAGAIATATATCPQDGGGKGQWRAISGGFFMDTYTVPPFGGEVVIPYGSGVIFESQRVGQRSWRVSAQSLWGQVNLKALANCQRGAPKPRAITQKVATPGADQLGPALTAQCPSGRAVSGGFATPAPFAAGEAANTVTDLFPTGTRAWRLRVVSNQPSSVTVISYCAERGRKPKLASGLGGSQETKTSADTVASSTGQFCPVKRFAPGGGGFRQQGATASQYFLPTVLYQGPAFDGDPRTQRQGYIGNNWHASGLKVGTGTPVRLSSVALCG